MPQNPPPLDTLRILITGCSTGIGRALAVELQERGAHVTATARDPDMLDGLSCDARLALDVTSKDSIAAALDKAGDIDVLINNAGCSIWGPVELVDIETALAMFNVNFFGAMRMCQAVAPAMRARRTGQIVQISSAAGRSVTPLVGYYSASKHALEAASEALKIELAPFGVRVCCISLGAVTTSLGEKRIVFESPDYQLVTDHFRARIAQKRKQATSAEAVAIGVADVIAGGSIQFRYDVTEDSKTGIAYRRSLSDADYEAALLDGLKLE